MNKSKSKLDIFPNRDKLKAHERYDLAQKTPILDKYDANNIEENDVDRRESESSRIM